MGDDWHVNTNKCKGVLSLLPHGMCMYNTNHVPYTTTKSLSH